MNKKLQNQSKKDHGEVGMKFMTMGSEEPHNYDWSNALRVPAKRLENKLISIRLPMTMITELRGIAATRNLGYQQLIKQYIASGIRSDDQTINFGAGFQRQHVINMLSSSTCLNREFPLTSVVSGELVTG